MFAIGSYWRGVRTNPTNPPSVRAWNCRWFRCNPESCPLATSKRIECALNPVFRASTRNAHLRKRILMRITQSTSVGGLNLHWFIDCEAREMAGSAWSVEETRALLKLWGDDRVQRQLEGSWKLFLTIGLCLHTLQVSYDGRAVDRDDIPPPAHSSHQFRVRVYARDYAIIHQ